MSSNTVGTEMYKGSRMLVFYDENGNKQLRGPGVDILWYLKTRKWTTTPPVINKKEEAVEVVEKKSKKDK